ncbi:TauD/TfdA family dioxygenase [Catellatospora sichuanensis]|uniref:TauD/TfdA family dioxygenase n=1 Tax=Catellatospora sichuanensis TaxID=1969805 RepID=UPI00118297C7|nr:TauD/TfdA family dioxygenase [Catellatospora sichuanensis]
MMSWRDELEAHGWAVLDHIAAHDVASKLGQVSPPMRLEPKDTDDARPWSLSGVYGLGAFPWHTDGAISSNPPRWMLLQTIELSDPTWTELLAPVPDTLAGLRRTTLRAVDRAGRVSYLPAVVPLGDGRLRLRWDPRICTPRTGLTVDEVEGHVPTARVEWQPGRLLVVDNFRIMHRRPAVHGQTKRLLERTYAWDR